MSASDRTKTLNDALTSVIASLDKEEELKKVSDEALPIAAVSFLYHHRSIPIGSADRCWRATCQKRVESF